MRKTYILRLTQDERETLREVIGKLKGFSQKVRRAHILLKADVDGPNWTDKQIAKAYACRTKTVKNVRQTLVTEGFDMALDGRKRATTPRPKRLDELAHVISMRQSHRSQQMLLQKHS